jgi:hypothetical protein
MNVMGLTSISRCTRRRVPRRRVECGLENSLFFRLSRLWGRGVNAILERIGRWRSLLSSELAILFFIAQPVRGGGSHCFGGQFSIGSFHNQKLSQMVESARIFDFGWLAQVFFLN